MKKLWIILLISLSTGPVIAQTKSGNSLTPAQQLAIEKAVLTEMKTSGTPGASLAIMSNNKMIYEKWFGLSNTLTKTPLNDSTMFQVGSVTKIFTSMALLSELQRAGISIQSPIGAIISGLSPGLSQLTYHQLLSHTSGMIDFWPGPNECNLDVFTFFETRGDSVLFTKPGEVFSYCNIGYALAGLALEKLTGKSFTEAIGDIIIKPLKLSHTTFDFYSVACNSFSAGHILDRSTSTVMPYVLNVSCPLVQAAGGLYSTAHDLGRLAVLLMNKGELDGQRIFDEAIIERMLGKYAGNFTTSSFGFASFPDNAYGYGIFTFNPGKWGFFGNIGIASQMTYLMCEPEKKLAIVILSNLQMDMLVDSFKKICEVVLNESLPPSPVMELDKAESREVTGSYLLHAIDHTSEVTADIMEENGRLYIRLPGAEETELTRTSTWEYSFRSPETRFPVEILFEKDESGKVRYMRYYWVSWQKVKR